MLLQVVTYKIWKTNISMWTFVFKYVLRIAKKSVVMMAKSDAVGYIRVCLMTLTLFLYHVQS